MEDDKAKREIESLRTIRNRWRLRGWRFNPLGRLCVGLGDGEADAIDRMDGESEVIDSLYALKNSPLCWPSIANFLWEGCSWSGSKPETLIDELEDQYLMVWRTWEQFRTVFDCEATQRERYRWRPYGTYPAKLRHEVLRRYWELKTTSRYSVASAIPNLSELRRVNYPSGQIEDRHLLSLAVMVCVVRAIESLEGILHVWRSDSLPYLKGRPFDWMALHEADGLEFVLIDLLMKDTPGNRAFFVSEIADAAGYQRQADTWFAHADTLFVQDQKLEQAVQATKTQTLAEVANARRSQARDAAKMPRKKLTPELVASHWKSNRGKARGALIIELMEKYEAAERTVERHLKEAREKNLLS